MQQKQQKQQKQEEKQVQLDQKTQSNSLDFASERQIRWCPGCGDFAILKSFRKALADIGTHNYNVVCVSGIGCAARMPYYIKSYGFHTVHGRAAAIATGVKIANPKLDVWAIGGDGDFLSIGLNHLIHALRRNIDVNFMLINNAVYGLTKGQYSPTSPAGLKTPSTPKGAIERSINALEIALASGCGFVARSIDVLQPYLSDLLVRARHYRGAAFVEILQNCPVFNDKIWQKFNIRTSSNHAILLEHGKPMIFGDKADKGLVFDGKTSKWKIVKANTKADKKKIALHDKTNLSRARELAVMGLLEDNLPLAFGIIYEVNRIEFTDATEKNNPYVSLSLKDFENFLNSKFSWRVK